MGINNHLNNKAGQLYHMEHTTTPITPTPTPTPTPTTPTTLASTVVYLLTLITQKRQHSVFPSLVDGERGERKWKKIRFSGTCRTWKILTCRSKLCTREFHSETRVQNC